MTEVSEHEPTSAPTPTPPPAETSQTPIMVPTPVPVEQGAGAAQATTEDTPSVDPTLQLKQQRLENWQNNGTVNATDAAALAQLPDLELQQLDLLLKDQAVSKDQVAEYLQLSPDERQELYRRETLTNSLIEEGHFSADYRESLREQPAGELEEFLEEMRKVAEVDAAIAADPAAGIEVGDRQGLAGDLLEWAGKGGIIDKAVTEVVTARIYEEFDQKLDQEAAEAWEHRSEYDPAELSRRKLDILAAYEDPDQFIAAFKAQRLLDPDYVQARDQQIQKEVAQSVDEIRRSIRVSQPQGETGEGTAELDSDEPGAVVEDAEEVANPEDAPKEPETAEESKTRKIWDMLKVLSPMLMEQLAGAGDKTLEQLLNNDFGEFLRALLVSSNGYSRERMSAGKYGAGKESAFGNEQFADVIKKPLIFGEALADAYENDELRQAGFKIDGEVLAKLKKGEPAAIRQAMESFLKDLFNGAETSETLATRWEVARKVLPDMMYPGRNLALNESVRENLKSMHASIGVEDGAFNKAFPAVEAASQSEAVEAEPKTDTVDQQPTGTASSVAPQPKAA